MPGAISRGTAWQVRWMVTLAWGVMVCFCASLAAGFAGATSQGRLFDRYAGTFVWIPYLWIAGLPWWSGASRAERRSVVRFSTWTLWLTVVMGVVDLVEYGWSGAASAYTPGPSPWRFLAYWLISAAWLVLLRGKAVQSWVEAGAPESQTDAGGLRGGRTRG